MRMIRRAATHAFILSILTGSIHSSYAQRSSITTPESVIGFKPGTDRMLADFAQISEFYRRLAKATPRMQLCSIGKTTEGREMILAAVSSEQNLSKRARYQEIARKLADSRGLTDESARALAREGKTIA